MKVQRINLKQSFINENVVFDEFEETITEETKEYIDIAKNKIVIEKLFEAELLYYFTLFFRLVEKSKYYFSNIALLLWLKTVRWFSLESCQEMYIFQACGYQTECVTNVLTKHFKFIKL